MYGDEWRRSQRPSLDWQDWVDQNPEALQSIATALQTLFTRIETAQASLVDAAGGIERIWAMVRMFGDILVGVKRALPPNWPTGLQVRRAIELANAGIPVVWVPPGPVLTKVAAAGDRQTQLAVLQLHVEEVRAGVEQVLQEVTHPALAGQLALARAAVAAWTAGYPEAAQALAVTVTDTLVSKHYRQGRGYGEVRDTVKLDLDGPGEGTALSEIRFAFAVAPIASFYTPWFPSSGEPAPEPLSRHVTVHQADHAHYTADNALIAVLLQASILRAFQEVLERQDRDDPG